MRGRFGTVALVIAVGILGWAWGSHKRTEEELNSVYYPILYSEVIKAVDQGSKQAVDFQISWNEDVSPNLKGTEPTRVLKYPDKSQAVTIVRRRDKKNYAFEISSEGYKPYPITIEPAEWYINSDVMDEVLVVELEAIPIAAKE